MSVQPSRADVFDKSERPARSTVSNYEVFNKVRSKRDSKINYMQSELSLRAQDVNRAIKMGRRAVELDPDDIDARLALGEALYQKVKSTKTKTPETFNECVKTWLLIQRNVVGEEKGLTYKGLGIPFINKFYEDEDHSMLARERLTALCGRSPKMWETNKKFLDKVLQPETSVSGVIVKGNPTGATNNETK